MTSSTCIIRSAISNPQIPPVPSQAAFAHFFGDIFQNSLAYPIFSHQCRFWHGFGEAESTRSPKIFASILIGQLVQEQRSVRHARCWLLEQTCSEDQLLPNKLIPRRRSWNLFYHLRPYRKERLVCLRIIGLMCKHGEAAATCSIRQLCGTPLNI
jgi:hypothetical protein